jgi:diadenosine tetraphosphate (Ap4A) HIT family hydrolase
LGGDPQARVSVPAAIAAVSTPVCDLALSHARLMLDARYPWIVLVPKAAGLVEIEDLSPADRATLLEEAVLAGQAVRAVGQVCGLAVEKLNIAALGNVTPDLHVHVVGRRKGDPAWPGPVWGVGEAVAYDANLLAAAVAAAKTILEKT